MWNFGLRDPDGYRLEFWDTVTWQRLKFLALAGPVRLLTYSPDGRYLLIGYEDGRLQLRAARSYALLADLSGHPDLSGATFDAAASQLITVSTEGTLRVWDLSVIQTP